MQKIFVMSAVVLILGCKYVETNEAINFLVQEKSSNEMNLVSVVKSGDEKKVREVMNAFKVIPPEQLNKSLIVALKSENTEIFKALLEAGADPNLPNAEGQMPIIFVSMSVGREEFMKLLLDYGANIDSDLKVYGTPLIVALRGRHFDVALHLLERGANPYIGFLNDENLLSYLCEEDDWYSPQLKKEKEQLIKFILERYAYQFGTGCLNSNQIVQ